MPPSLTALTFWLVLPTVCTVGYKYAVGFADFSKNAPRNIDKYWLKREALMEWTE